MTTTITTNKPFHIDKKCVYEAYKAVKSNAGSAGADGQTIEQFDSDLQIPVHRGQSFRRIADSVPVIADSF
jgi:retron-type reverse transcriptase